VAATLLPAQSEAVMSALLLDGRLPIVALLVASAGNVLGAWLTGSSVAAWNACAIARGSP
jgi:membrane protein YqaA with SNARE-associated domain